MVIMVEVSDEIGARPRAQNQIANEKRGDF